MEEREANVIKRGEEEDGQTLFLRPKVKVEQLYRTGKEERQEAPGKPPALLAPALAHQRGAFGTSGPRRAGVPPATDAPHPRLSRLTCLGEPSATAPSSEVAPTQAKRRGAVLPPRRRQRAPRRGQKQAPSAATGSRRLSPCRAPADRGWARRAPCCRRPFVRPAGTGR